MTRRGRCEESEYSAPWQTDVTWPVAWLTKTDQSDFYLDKQQASEKLCVGFFVSKHFSVLFISQTDVAPITWKTFLEFSRLYTATFRAIISQEACCGSKESCCEQIKIDDSFLWPVIVSVVSVSHLWSQECAASQALTHIMFHITDKYSAESPGYKEWPQSAPDCLEASTFPVFKPTKMCLTFNTKHADNVCVCKLFNTNVFYTILGVTRVAVACPVLDK